MFTDRKVKAAISKSQRRQKLQQDQMIMEKGKTLERNQTRDWKAGDIYSPHDLSPSEMKKWRKKHSPPTDAFDALSINPLHQYKVQPGFPPRCSPANSILIIRYVIEFFDHVGIYD